MRRIFPLFGVILLTAGVLLGLFALEDARDILRPGGPSRLVRFAGPLLRVENPSVSLPSEDTSVPMGGVPLLVRFPENGRVLPDTFRCLLNGQDVTHQLTIGVNGVAGTVFPLREGENQVRLEVFGKSLWGRRYYQDFIEFPIRARPFVIDRA